MTIEHRKGWPHWLASALDGPYGFCEVGGFRTPIGAVLELNRYRRYAKAIEGR